MSEKYLIIFHGLGEGICCPLVISSSAWWTLPRCAPCRTGQCSQPPREREGERGRGCESGGGVRERAWWTPPGRRARSTSTSCDARALPRQSLRRGRQKSIFPQDSGFQKWRSPSEALLNEYTPLETLAWFWQCQSAEFGFVVLNGRAFPGFTAAAVDVWRVSLVIIKSTHRWSVTRVAWRGQRL